MERYYSGDNRRYSIINLVLTAVVLAGVIIVIIMVAIHNGKTGSSSGSGSGSGSNPSLNMGPGLTTPYPCATFAVIAIDDMGSTKEAFPNLLAIKSKYLLQKYATSVISPLVDAPESPAEIHAWVTSQLIPKMVEVDRLVRKYINAGYNYIHLPTTSAIIAPFANGFYTYNGINATEQVVSILGGINITMRYPANVQFTVSNVGTSAVDRYVNMIRFADVTTTQDSSIVVGNVNSFGGVAGDANNIILFVNQAGDSFSQSNYADTADILMSEGNYTASQIKSVNLTLIGANYSTPDVVNVNATIALLVAHGARHIIVAMNPAGSQTAGFAFKDAFAVSTGFADFEAIEARYSSNVTIVFWGLNVGPSVVFNSYDVDTEIGYANALPLPGLEYNELLGYPLEPNAFSLTEFPDPYVLDALKWASKCYSIATVGYFNSDATMQGTPYKFIHQTLATYFIVFQRIPAGELSNINSYEGYRISARWSNQASTIIDTTAGGL
jgi:hypothetical protein